MRKRRDPLLPGERWKILVGDCRSLLSKMGSGTVQSIVTSPPYWAMRDYGVKDGQIGLEPHPNDYVAELVDVFREARRVLHRKGTLWLNLGDSYAQGGRGGVGETSTLNGASYVLDESRKAQHAMGAGKYRETPAGWKRKDLLGLPWRVALALQDDGWYLRCDVIWHKPAPVPESVHDRPTRAHEYVFLLSRSRHYFYDATAIAEPTKDAGDNTPEDVARAFSSKRQVTPRQRQGELHRVGMEALSHRNARSVWTIPPSPTKDKTHFAKMPIELARRCVMTSTSVDDVVLDPFAGAGTTGLVALQNQRRFVGVELNIKYAELAERRIREDAPLLNVGVLAG